jgi:D-alanyl-D-alanine carboxypeptidase
MMEKNKRILFAKALLLNPFCFLLIIFCLTALAIPCRATSSQHFLESGMDGDADSEADLDFQPADISVRDSVVRAGLLYDVAADTIVWEKNKDSAFPIASLTKMMVALIAMEDIFDGKVGLDTTVKVTPEAAKMTGSKVYLKTGCCVSVEELLKAALISSGNDAAYLLAQFLGGSESAFVARMNKRAMRLGMKNTYYSNSTGMPASQSEDDNRSSPHDLLILSKEMLKYEQLIEIAGMSNAIITQDQKPIKLRNHNGLVATYEEVDGFKTGFTQNAKYCLVATANKNDRRLISIVLGVSNRNTRNQFVAASISRYYEALGMGGLERKTGSDMPSCIAKNSSPDDDAAPKTAAAGSQAGQVHRVKKGDTLYKIANRYGCEVSELKSWNQIRGNRIEPGQQLAIYQALPGGESGDEPAQAAIQNNAVVSKNKSQNSQPSTTASQQANSRIIYYYTVRPGDTLWTISQKYDGVSVKNIMKTNRIKRIKTLKPGTTLKIVTDV